MYFKEFAKNAKSYPIKKALVMTNKDLNRKILKKRWTSGSTGNILVINKDTNTFFMSNTGDSRGFAVYKSGIVKQLSIDHKPNSQKERKRIMKQGGFVKDGRVDGILAVARSFGDKQIAKHLSIIPDISSGSTKNIAYFFQASDGIFDVLTNNRIKSLISLYFKKGLKIDAIAKRITTMAIKSGSMDNVSVVITLV